MAKVKITGHASGSGILTITAPNTSTDRTITLPDATGTLLNSDGSAASLTAIPAANITGTLPAIDGGSLTGITTGKVLQVVSVEKSDTFTTTSTSFADITGLSVSITPSATSSKILVLVDVGIGNASAGYTTNVRLMRDSTAISVGDASSSRVQSTGNYVINLYHIASVAVNKLDTPATTSSVTYKLQLKAEATSTADVNRPGNNNDNSYTARTASHITLMEIGA